MKTKLKARGVSRLFFSEVAQSFVTLFKLKQHIQLIVVVKSVKIVLKHNSCR